MSQRHTSFAIKADIHDPTAETFSFTAYKTMYGGKNVAAGDRIYLFASENAGGSGLLARGIVTGSEPTPRTDAGRQTPRVTVTVRRDGTARRPLGRSELRAFRGRSDATPETELDFKLYRQATNKIVGLTDAASDYLDRLFLPCP